jgi:uncharacterized protein YidB (DUF937 family)
MGLLDQLLSEALAGTDSARTTNLPQSSNLLEGVLAMLAAKGGGQGGSAGGGIQALARMFQQQGLGDVFDSWIGPGQNRAVSTEQLGRVFGGDQFSDVAQRAGVSSSQGLGMLAQMLPLVIDRLTPQGRVPQQDPLRDIGQRLLGQLGGAGGGTRMVGDKPKPDFSNVKSGSSSTAPAPAKPAAKTYTVVAGDNLSKIAKRFYGDANKWKKIFEANTDIIKNPDLIKPGQTLKIPD